MAAAITLPAAASRAAPLPPPVPEAQQAVSAAVPPPPRTTAWTRSVHEAFARQARDAVRAAHHAYIQSGLASWYGHAFAGRRTSSGSRFDPRLMTCAHRTLPLGTKVLVTASNTGRSVVVTVNDRGPFAGHGRIIDLSREAAARLGFVSQGLNNVTVEKVAPPEDTEVAEAP